jgi:CheY-like chemotaxis protein
VGRLRDFYRPREATDLTETGNLKKLIEEAAKLTRPRWKDQALAEGRQFEVLYELEEVTPIACNPSEIREMLVNLIFNAVDAMPRGGKLTLRTYHQEGRVAFDVGDSGTGMTEEVRKRCMEPFFSTKGEKGTGLGLAMVFGIVQRHDGKLDIESELGVGTTFKISFPPRFAVEEVATQKIHAKANRPLHILYAEDDPELRTIIPYTLEAQGHFVTIAIDGSEALLRLEDRNFDLLMTDFSMPVVNGEQLAVAAKKIARDMPVILLTGFGNMNRADGVLPNGVDLIVEKPFTSRDLETAIGRVLTL